MTITRPLWVEVLSDDYVPKQLMFRDKELQILRESVEDFWTNYYIEGPKSSGKTVTVKKFIEESQQLQEHSSLYIGGGRALMHNFEVALETALGRKLKFREHAFDAFQKLEGKHIHLVIDDINKLFQMPSFNNFLHSVFECCLENHKHLHLICVGTISFPQFMKRIRDDVESRYHFRPIIFQFYDAPEIEAIIKQRLEIIGVSYDKEATAFISAKIKRLVTDLRLGFDILMNAFKIANGEKITMPIMEQAWERTKVDYWILQLRQLDEHSKMLILAACIAAKDKETEPIISGQEIVSIYRNICYWDGVEPLYKQRLTFLFKKLAKNDWLTEVEQLSRGRHGWDVVYRFEMNAETILAALKEMGYAPSEIPKEDVATATDKQAKLPLPEQHSAPDKKEDVRKPPTYVS